MAVTDDLHSLITRTAWGDRQAFAALYRATAPRLLTLSQRIVGSRALAEEALQEALVQAWYSAREYHPGKGSPLAWLAGIVRHRAMDLRRREGRQRDRDQAAADEHDLSLDQPTATAAHHSTELQALLTCMEGLPEQQRETLLLTYCHGYSNSELAKRLATPLGTVKSWARRAMASVRMCLES